MELNIRQEHKDDHKEVYEINTLAFGQEDEAKLVDLLRNSDAFVPELSLVATFGNKIVGHILFSKITIVDTDQNTFDSLALAPIAVRPDFQNKGIGGHLIKSGLDQARKMNFKSVIVLGHEHYYPKFGFVPAEKWNIKAPFEVPVNVFMGMELIPDALKYVSGTVKYPKEFDI